MADVCPSCSSEVFLTRSSEDDRLFCTQCGFISQDVDLYDPARALDTVHAYVNNAATRVSLPPRLTAGALSLEESRKLQALRRRPEIIARLRFVLQRLEKPNLLARTEFLFDQARSKSWRQTGQSSQQGSASTCTHADCGVQWGEPSFRLAAACCFAVLRSEGHRIDICAVAHAADLTVPKLRASVRQLVRILGLPHLQLSCPETYISDFLAFLSEQAGNDTINTSARTFLRLSFVETQASSNTVARRKATARRNIEAIALDICSFWWPQRSRQSGDAQLVAFAIVLMSLEAYVKTVAPRHQIFLLYPLARRSRASSHESGSTANAGARSLQSLWTHYDDVLSALDQAAQRVPWLLSSKYNDTGKRSDRRKTLSDTLPACRHRELIANLVDILQICKQAPVENSSITHGFQTKSRTTAKKKDHFSLDPLPVGQTPPDNALTVLERALQALPAQGGQDQAVGDDQTRNDTYSTLRARVEAAALLPDHGAASEASASHALDVLTDEQIDALLFTSEELDSVFRSSQAERDAVLAAKVAAGIWDQAAPASYDFPIRQQLRPDAPKPCRSHTYGKRGSETGGAKRPKLSMSSGQAYLNTVSAIALEDQHEESDWSDSFT